MADNCEKLTINDALRLASTDNRFASGLLENPEKFAEAFNIGKDEIRGLVEVQERMKINPGDMRAGLDYE